MFCSIRLAKSLDYKEIKIMLYFVLKKVIYFILSPLSLREG